MRYFIFPQAWRSIPTEEDAINMYHNSCKFRETVLFLVYIMKYQCAWGKVCKHTRRTNSQCRDAHCRTEKHLLIWNKKSDKAPWGRRREIYFTIVYTLIATSIESCSDCSFGEMINDIRNRCVLPSNLHWLITRSSFPSMWSPPMTIKTRHYISFVLYHFWLTVYSNFIFFIITPLPPIL